MKPFGQAATPAATPTTGKEQDLLVAAYNALDANGRTQLMSYAQYLVEQASASAEQRAKAMEFNQELAKAAADNRSVLFR